MLRRPWLWIPLVRMLVLVFGGAIIGGYTLLPGAVRSQGQARADAVKQALFGENSIDPTRVFVSTTTSVMAKDAQVEMALMVK